MFRDFTRLAWAGGGAMLLGAGVASAASYEYKDITVAGAADTRAIAVNASHQVAGSYTTAAGLLQTFVLRNGNIQTIQAPAPDQRKNISPTAIGPTGLVAGVYGDVGVQPFVLAADSTTPTKLASPPGAHRVIPTSISQNKLEDVAGYLWTEDAIWGFNTQAHFSEFVSIQVPGSTLTAQTAYAQSSVGYEIPVGNFITDAQHGFFADSSTPVDPPGSISTSITYLNNGGRVGGDLGGFYSSKQGFTLGFVRRGSKFTSYRYPLAPHTTVVRNLGDVVFGEFKDNYGRPHGYVYAGGKYQLVGDLNDEVTLTSVADDGSFVGSRRGADGRFHGYLATCASGPGTCAP